MESGVKEDLTDDTFTLVKQQFDEFADATIDCRRLAERCRDYYDGNQWTDEERRTLAKRKQPCITDNKIKDKCDTMLGIEKQMRTDPKAYPRTPGDDESAEAATDALRFVADQSKYHRTTRKPAAENLIIEGLCGGQVIVEKTKKRPKVCMEHIRWDRLFYDIHSLEPDFSDCNHKGFFTWMDYSDAIRMFKGKKEALQASCDPGAKDRTHDDKPRYVQTVRARKRIQIFEHYFKVDGVWNFAKWCQGGWLEEPKPSSYKDENDEPTCCIEIQSLYRDSEGMPYGAVPRLIDLQDEHNKRRSKMLHLLNAKRVIVRKGEFEDINRLRTEVHKPDGVVEVSGNIDQVRVEDNLRESAGQFQLMQQTEAALSATGPNGALQGDSGSISGRAKQLDQQAGTLQLTPLFDALDGWELRMYQQAWLRARQFWTAEMWVRVTDDEQKVKFVALNQTVTQADLKAQQLKDEQIPDEEKRQILEQIAQDPQLREPARDERGKPIKKNAVAEMDIDIIIDRTQDIINVQQEQFEMLASIAETRPEIPFEILVEMSQLRSEIKKRVTDRLKGEDNPQAAQMAQMQQMMQELATKLQMQELALKQAQTDKTDAEADKIREETVSAHVNTASQLVQSQTPQAEMVQ